MQVFVEDVFLDNFLIDFCLLFATSKILHLGTKWWQLCLGAALGVGQVLLLLAFPLDGALWFAYKFLSALVLVVIILPKHGFSKLFATFCTFFALTFVSGGACLMLSISFGGTYALKNGQIAYSLALPMGIIFGTIFFVLYAICRLFGKIRKKIFDAGQEFWVSLLENGKKITLKAFLDTGNRLVDPTTNRPIVFITYRHFARLFQNVSPLALLFEKNALPLKNSHYITCQTVGKSQKLLVFDIDEVLISTGKTLKPLHASLALTFSNFGAKKEYGLLLGPKAIYGVCYE